MSWKKFLALPDREAVRSNTYPLASPFYAVTTKNSNPNVKRLMEWILSPQGQDIIEKTGYTPL